MAERNNKAYNARKYKLSTKEERQKPEPEWWQIELIRRYPDLAFFGSTMIGESELAHVLQSRHIDESEMEEISWHEVAEEIIKHQKGEQWLREHPNTTSWKDGRGE